MVEGVSHFLYLAERARRELPTTQLELELQAEVDKYVLFAHGADAPRPFHPARAARMRARLFDRVAYLHPANTETARATGWPTIWRRASPAGWRHASRGTDTSCRCARELRRFYGAGQAEKIGLARAA